MITKKDVNVIVGANIKREREKAGYTQEQFSEMIGMGVKNLSAVERGTVGISLSMLKKSVRSCPYPAMRFYLNSTKITMSGI